MFKYLLALLIIPTAFLTVGVVYSPKTEAQKLVLPIQQFHFTYNGTVRYALQDYKIENKDGKIVLTLDGNNEFQREEHIVTQKTMDELHALLQACDIMKWDGFSENDPNILDGYSFHLTIRFQDDNRLSAHGTNSFPVGFGDTQKQIAAFFEAHRTKKEGKE